MRNSADESTLFADDTAALRVEYLRLVRVALPAAAATADPPWPIRLDHCFMRVVLDALFGRPWRDVLDDRTPAYRQLSAAQLSAAIDLARSMLSDPTGGRVRALNDVSLRGRTAVSGGAAGRPAAGGGGPAARGPCG